MQEQTNFYMIWEHILALTIPSQYFIIFLHYNQFSDSGHCIKNTPLSKTLDLFLNCVERHNIDLIIHC